MYGKSVRHAQAHTNHKRGFGELADLVKFDFGPPSAVFPTSKKYKIATKGVDRHSKEIKKIAVYRKVYPLRRKPKKYR